jgi:serine/threonine-protein kinase HipA
VGVLAENEAGVVAFRFADAYRSLAARPVLSQSFEDALERTYTGKRPGQLPAFFSNLLPEGRFREILEASLPITQGDDLGLLAATANDLPGGVALAPVPATSFDVSSEATNGNGSDEDAAAVGLRFSLAGVQLKFSMVRRDERLALPAHGGRGDWIIKVGSHEYGGLAENEYAVMGWARDAGFEVPEIELRRLDDVPEIRKYAPPESMVFGVRRYDRDGERRIHQEDFMQVFGWPQESVRKYMSKYEALGRVVTAVLGDEGFEEFVRRLAFVVASGNGDAHLKNWSVLYEDASKPRFAPLYDQVATIAWPHLERTLALKLTGAREFGRVDLESFRRLAAAAGVSPDRTAAVVGETLSGLREAWKRTAGKGTLWPEHARLLVEHWARVPLLRSAGSLEG